MDEVFKALADPTRRSLLEELYRQDGQTLSTLEGHLGDRARRRTCRLTVTHDQMREDANPEIYGGWPQILSGLKTLLETGQSLTTPDSLRYSEGQASAS